MEGRMEREEKQENFFYEKSAQRPESKKNTFSLYNKFTFYM